MDDMQAKIAQYKALQTQTRRWRFGGVVAILLVVGGCMWHVRTRALALVDNGPTHDRFVADLKKGLTHDVVPVAQRLTMETLNRLGPAVQKEMEKLETRLPEITDRAEKEMALLRKNLPERAEKALKPTFGKALDSRLAVWKKQYPDLTAEQLSAASGRLVNEVHDRMANVASVVVLPYESSFEKITAHLDEIRRLEAGHPEVDPWDLAIVSVGLLHEQLMKYNPQARQLFVASLDKQEVK
ncbi:MAG: hypothetical protein PCFJNLEI_01776 [Verrucomicrobiae bacterium]|nr:hypothetical protein [Verrucomicrobiae bacterium]